MAGKISEYPSSITTLASGDLFDVSEFLNPGYESKKLDWSTLLTELNSQLTFENIYTTDGTTTGERTISIGTNDLIFGSTGDTNLLRFDATADRIGIGTSTPSEKLNIVGGMRIDGAGLNQLYVSPSSNFVGNGYTSNPSGLSNTRLATSGRMFAALSYSANDIALVSFSGGNIARFTNYSAGQDVELVTTSAADDVKIKNGATTTLISQGSTSNIGIGTLTPTQKLEVVGNTYTTGQGSFGTPINPNSHLQVTASGKIVGIAGTSNAITASGGAAIRGTANSTAAVEVYGVDGSAAGTNGSGDRTGVRGNAITTGSRNHVGGKFVGNNGSSQNIGVKATTGNGTTGTIIRGVFGESLYQGASNAYGGYFSAQGASTGENIGIFATAVNGATNYAIKSDGNVNMANLPTSSAGLSAGDLWNNAGVINIV